MVAAAVIGSAVVGGAVASSASKKAAAAQNNATAAASAAEGERLGLDRERFAFEKAQYEDGAADRAFASSTARSVAEKQIASMDQQYEISDDYWNYQKNTFRPLEIGLVRDAENFDTEASRESEAARAVADVSQRFGLARTQSQRDMARRGVNPSSGKALALASNESVIEAATAAGAANKARSDIKAKGYAMRADAAGLGRNLATNQTAAATTAINAGNSGVTNSQVPIAVANNGTDRMSGAYGSMSGSLNTNASRILQVGGIQSQNFYNSQAFGKQAGSDVSNMLVGVYGMATGQYNPFA